MKKKINWFLINENYGANLCPYAFHFDADYHGFKKILGRGMHYQAVGTENGFLRQAYDLDDYNDFAQFVFNKLSNDKKFARNMLRHVYQAIVKRNNFDHTVLKSKLDKISNKKLASIFAKFYDYFFEMSTWSVPFAFTEYSTALWSNYLIKHLTNLPLIKNETPIEIYQILTSNLKKTYTAREKESILKLAIEVYNTKSLHKVFLKSVDIIVDILPKKNKLFWNKIKKHEKEYNWINFGFEGPLLDKIYFISIIKDWVINKNPFKEYEAVKSEKHNLYKRQNQLIKKLHIDKKHQWMFWVVREFSYQKTYRKDVEYYSYYSYHVLLQEFARRFSISVNQAHYLLKDEIVLILLGRKKINEKLLNDRIKCNFYVVINGKANLLVGDKAKNFIKKIKSRPVPKGLKELEGQSAYLGKVTGLVKIIKNKDDYNKFNTGDVLVTYATNPNMVVLMKRASAIITDEGGVTCHAAIVSRELRVPCIIGTRFATKVLKDGDKVEVDANKGVVKKMVNKKGG